MLTNLYKMLIVTTIIKRNKLRQESLQGKRQPSYQIIHHYTSLEEAIKLEQKIIPPPIHHP